MDRRTVDFVLDCGLERRIAGVSYYHRCNRSCLHGRSGGLVSNLRRQESSLFLQRRRRNTSYIEGTEKGDATSSPFADTFDHTQSTSLHSKPRHLLAASAITLISPLPRRLLKAPHYRRRFPCSPHSQQVSPQRPQIRSWQ